MHNGLAQQRTIPLISIGKKYLKQSIIYGLIKVTGKPLTLNVHVLLHIYIYIYTTILFPIITLFQVCVYFRMIAGMLEVLELSFNVPSNDENKLSLKATAIEVASQLLILPTPPPVQMHTTALLAALHPSKQAYHLHKVSKSLNVYIITVITIMYM